jgi:chemotaxis protein methyltransferase CheR
MDTTLAAPDLAAGQFEKISALVYQACGINLRAGKEELVRSRLSKRLRELALPRFEDYVRYIERDASGRELAFMVDALTTNKTSFFRESPHFDCLRDLVLPALAAQGAPIRLWSAGCSSGEEPYSIAMFLLERLGQERCRNVRILATDLCERALAKAQAGVYPEAAAADVPALLRHKYMTLSGPRGRQQCVVGDSVRSLVRFARLNLMDDWPMKGPFDVIFCRNVMIYFDKPTQQALVERFRELLPPGGYLFVGHSESLASSARGFRPVQPAVYVR